MHFLYLSNSTFHYSSFLGYFFVYGLQSAILNPECVNLVYPPSTIIPSTPAAVKNNHPPTILSLPYLTSYVEKLNLLLFPYIFLKGLLNKFRLIFLVNILL